MADQLSLPDLLTQQALLQQRQKFGQQLLQQANTPNPVFQQPASGGPYGVVPKYGLGNGLVTLGQALIGAKMTRDASRDYAQLMGNGWQGTPQPPPANIPDDPSQNAITPSEPGYQPPPAAYGQALVGSSGPLAGVDPQTVKMIALTEGPAGLAKLAETLAEQRLAPSEFSRDLISLGVPPGSPAYAQLMGQHLAKENYMAPTEVRPGGTALLPGTNIPLYRAAPAPPPGMRYTGYGPDGTPTGIEQLPGYAQAAGAVKGAEAQATTLNTPVNVPQQGGGSMPVMGSQFFRTPAPVAAPSIDQNGVPTPTWAGGNAPPPPAPVKESPFAVPDVTSDRFYAGIPRLQLPSGAGPQSTYNEARMKSAGEFATEEQKKLEQLSTETSNALVPKYKLLETMRDTPGSIDYGPLGGRAKFFKALGNELGINFGDPKPDQTFDKYAYQNATTALRQIYGGRITEKEAEMQIENSPGRSLSEKANYALLDTAIKRDEVSMKMAPAFRGYVQRGGDPLQFESWFNSRVPNASGIRGPTPATVGGFQVPPVQAAAPAPNVPAAAVAYLKQHPDLAPQFDAKYGAGASKVVLGR